MGEWLIYGSNGSQKATVKKLEYSGEFMGETSVTCDIYSPSPISFSIGDYLVYRGERFTIDYDATRLKQARNNTYGKGYTYENMRFLSYVGELKKCEFLDFVPSDNLIHFSQLPDFSFYAETVNDLADRIQANLDRIYTGGKAWTVQVVQGFEGKENINVSVSKSTCFDALRMAYEQFEATFIIRGRTITIGTAGNELETDFRYGKGNGLKTIERSVDESDAIVTRLRAYGNTTNMPANYYKNIGMKVYAPIYEIYHVSTTGCDIHFVPKLKNACFNDKNGQYQYWVSVSLDETLWLKAVASPNTHLSSTNYSVVTVGLYDGNTQAMVTQFNTQLQSGTYNKLYFKQGINVGAWPVEYREYAENVPDLMAIDRLMLPGFPELTTDPYIDSSNIATLGVREKSVYFDGSDPDTPDIHPTLEGMTAAELRAAGYVIDLDSGDNGNLDEIAADATETDGSPITADGAFEGVDEVPGFKVTIKDIGFDINDYLSTETATLVMKTGMCGGMEFTIVEVDKVGNKYVLECQRTEDVAHYFPYNPYLIKAGDKFVLTNLEMPKAYIDAASQRLLTAAQEYIAKYSEPQWVYAIKMDDVWMQRQRDNSVSEASSYYWNIKEGDVMNVTDSDLGVDITEVIDRLSIREGFGPIPEFEVVLRKEKPQGTIGVLQNRIRQLELRNAEQVSTIYRQQNYIDLIIGDKLNTIQEQLDHVQVTYFGDYVPTLSNEPASTWQSSEYSEHDGDMFYNRTTGKGYEFTYQNGTWGWIEIQDEDIRQALEDAAAAQDTADGKRRVFVTPAGTLPTPPYDENDLWVNATYPSNSTSTDESQHKYYNDILKCVTPKAEGGTASINDWTLASKYTDDSSLNAFINGSYADDLEDIQNQIDGKAETWYQSTDPSTAWTTTALKNQHKGDIWHNSSNTTINGVKAGQDAIWNGTAWVVDETVPQAVYDEIDGKCAIYVTWGAWGNDLQEKDLFIPAADTTQGGITYKANKVYRCVDKDTPLFQEIAYTDDTQYNGFITKLIGSSGQTKDAAENAIAAIKHALSDGNTYNEGGLILSNLISLGTGSPTSGTFTPWAGISGIYKTSETGTGYKGHGIAAWFGGGMIDKEVSAVSNAAKSLFRFDGSGYVADGNLSWDKNGNVTIQGYSINATTLQVGGANVATQAMLDNFVSKAFFNRLFTAYDANGNAIVPNNTTTAINNLKIMVGAWTEQYLSALGLNSEGGGGGTGDVSHIKIGTNPDVFLDPDEDGIIDMSSYAANWNDAYQKRHTHSNKSVLDGITSTKVSHWDAVYGVVPSAAYESGNQLADKNFVNSSISTATATFRGTVTASNDTDAAAATALATITTKDLNDYAFVKVENTPQTGVDKYKRYKYNGSSWVYEYTLNNSSFTSDQWNAINSGITTSLVTKLNGIASGAQVNVIETVKVNGSALTVTSKAVDITAVPLTIITGADDLKAIEGLSGTSGFLKKTAANTWALDTTVVLNTRTITAGNGLTGGGDLSANRTINVASANAAITVNADNIQLNVINDYTTTTNNTIIPLAAARGKDLNDRLAILESWFEVDSNGNVKTKDKPNNGGHRGFYTESFVSALGQNSQGGGGGTTDLNAVWGSLTTNTDEYGTEKIHQDHLPIAASDKLGAIKVGSTLQINSSGVLNQKSGVMADPDVYTKVTVDTYGRVTQGGDLIEGDIPTLSMSKISGLSTALGNVYTKTESDAKYVTALGTNGNYLTYTKNGNSNSITVPYATTANSLKNLYNYSTRPTSANLTHINNGGVQHFLATSSMATNKPANDGHILHFHWDTTAGWDSQLFLSDDPSKPFIQYRAENGDNGVWGSWITVLDTSNTSLSNGVININGSTITPLTAASSLNANNITSGTINAARLPSLYWANIPIQTTSDNTKTPTFGTGSALNYTNGNVYSVSNNQIWATPVAKYYWHDLFALGRAIAHPKVEVSTNGTTWTLADDTTAAQFKKFFANKENQTIQLLDDTHPYVRFTWNGGNCYANQAQWLVIGTTYNTAQATCTIVKEDNKADGTYKTVSTSTLTGNSAPKWVKTANGCESLTAEGKAYSGYTQPFFRITFSRTSAAGTILSISSIKYLTYRWGNQGCGSEYEYPYDWNEKGDVYPIADGENSLGLGSRRWYNVVSQYGNFSNNVNVGGILSVTGNATFGGKVGIGTTSPTYKLHIHSTEDAWAFHTHSWYNNSVRTSIYANYSRGNGLWVGTSQTTSSYYIAQFRKGITSEGGGGSSVLYIRADGNVGVNTDSPSYNLDVNGDLGVASGITLTTTKKIKFGTGNDAPYIELDSNGYFHFSAGLYSDSFVSALGANDQGGGGGEANLNAVWGSLTTNTDEFANEKIDNAHLNIASWALAANKPYYTWSEIQNKPSWIGASKPTYTFSEIGSTPTTLAGYGIIDAWSTTVSRTKNTVLAAPSNANGTASFRALVAADIPDLSSIYATASRATTLEGYFTDGVAKKAYHVEPSGTVSVAENTTVGDAKATLATMVNSQKYGIGDNILLSASIVSNWNNESASTYASSMYSIMKIGGAYNSSSYGQWLLSTLGTSKVGIVGRTTSGSVSSWTDIKWIPFTNGDTDITITKSGTSTSSFTAANGNGSISLSASGSNRGVYDVTNSAWLICTNGTNTYLQRGNVGIGTDSPTYKLHVNGTFRVANAASLGGTLSVSGKTTLSSVLNITGVGSFSEGIRIHHAGGLSSIWFGAENETGYDAGMWGISVNSNGMRFRGAASTTATSATDYVNILHGGNVGIGTTSPSYKLHVNGYTSTTRLYLSSNVYLEYDSTNGGVHLVGAGLYSDSYISALGANSQGGGGSTFDEEQMWQALDATNEVINTSHIPNLAASKITSGTFATARIPNLDASKIASGTFDVARIPNLSWSKITSGADDLAAIEALTGTSGFLKKTAANTWTLDTTSYATASDVTTLQGYFTNGVANNAAKLNNQAASYYATASSVTTLQGYFSSGSANTAVALKTARSIWGQSFDGTAAVKDNLYMLSSSASTLNSDSAKLKFNSYSADTSTEERRSPYIQAVGSGYTGYGRKRLGFFTSNASNYTDAFVEALSIVPTGEVGIGTTAPSYKLEVGGSIAATMSDTTNTSVRATNSNGTVSILSSTNRGLYDNTGSVWLLATDGTNSWLAKGNVGINNTSPAYKLDVNGTLNASGATTLGSTLSVTGKATMSAGLNITGSTDSYSQGIRIHDAGSVSSIWFRCTNATGNDAGMQGITGNSTGMIFRLPETSSGTSYNTYMTIAYGGIVTLGNSLYLPNACGIYCKDKSTTDYRSLITLSSSNNCLVGYGTIAGNGNTYIYTNNSFVVRVAGTASSNAALTIDSSKNATFAAEVTASSDARKKNIISETKFNVKDIASASSILYQWKDGDKNIHGGSIAQDWLGKADSFLMQDEDGFYSINYGALALCSAITIAREVLKHKDEIERLRQKVSYLESKVRELEERRVA